MLTAMVRCCFAEAPRGRCRPPGTINENTGRALSGMQENSRFSWNRSSRPCCYLPMPIMQVRAWGRPRSESSRKGHCCLSSAKWAPSCIASVTTSLSASANLKTNAPASRAVCCGESARSGQDPELVGGQLAFCIKSCGQARAARAAGAAARGPPDWARRTKRLCWSNASD